MNLGPLFSSIGDVGNQYGGAKIQAAQLKLKQFLDSLKAKQETVSLDDMQERLRRLKLSPDTEEGKLQAQIGAIRNQAKSLGITLTPEDERAILGLPAPAAPQKITNLDEAWLKSFQEQNKRFPTTEEIEAHQQDKKGPKKIKFNTVTGTGEVYSITDEAEKDWNVNDPNMPPALKSELANYRESQAKGEEKKAMVEARKSAETLKREMTMLNEREAMQERKKLMDVARRGITGHSYLTAVAQEVAAAEVTGGQGTTSGDRVIADGFMQLMFGPDAKGIRGSTQVMEVMLKQGGWSDQAIAKLNGALSGGKLSQDVRKQILETSQRQVGIWDSYVTQFGSLSEDKVSKSVIDKYWQAVQKQNDLGDLGGTKVQ